MRAHRRRRMSRDALHACLHVRAYSRIPNTVTWKNRTSWRPVLPRSLPGSPSSGGRSCRRSSRRCTVRTPSRQRLPAREQPLEGATPPEVFSRWMKVVAVSVSPPLGPAWTPAIGRMQPGDGTGRDEVATRCTEIAWPPQTMLESRESCHVARIVPSSVGVGAEEVGGELLVMVGWTGWPPGVKRSQAKPEVVGTLTSQACSGSGTAGRCSSGCRPRDPRGTPCSHLAPRAPSGTRGGVT